MARLEGGPSCLVGGGIGFAGLAGSSHGLIAKANQPHLVSIPCQYNRSFGRMLRGELRLIVALKTIPIQPRVALGRHVSTTISSSFPPWMNRLALL